MKAASTSMKQKLKCDVHLSEYVYICVLLTASVYLCFKVRVGVSICRYRQKWNGCEHANPAARGKLEILMDRKAALPTTICMLYMTY